jgi:hypothetical protein
VIVEIQAVSLHLMRNALGKATDNLGHTDNVVVSSSFYCIVTRQSKAFMTHLLNEAEP